MPATLSALEAVASALADDERAEIARREADLAAGRTTTIPGAAVLEELRDILKDHPDPIKAFDAILREGEN